MDDLKKLEQIYRHHQTQDDPEGITTREIAAAMEMPVASCRRMIRSLIEAGMLECRPVMRTQLLTGVRAKVPGFVMTERALGLLRSGDDA